MRERKGGEGGEKKGWREGGNFIQANFPVQKVILLQSLEKSSVDYAFSQSVD